MADVYQEADRKVGVVTQHPRDERRAIYRKGLTMPTAAEIRAIKNPFLGQGASDIAFEHARKVFAELVERESAELAELRRDAERWQCVLMCLGGSVVQDKEATFFGVRLPVILPRKEYANTIAEFVAAIDAAICISR